ncbi:hypothetical protein DGo_PE0007 (plasmid) [Deinococcus gobiensis I-0]|uniref:Uncharacterized protein n=1 Tax=Deinococcus gobiensis (strain DSM 21396 / JCM 16679 / CGMCC 1.7299 / I-0) TaxID=745776 RepID=H8H3Q4_DEIGI|nr:hypothetical protein DGo_PE0007 [Deinococcus gobiensis I-0]
MHKVWVVSPPAQRSRAAGSQVWPQQLREYQEHQVTRSCP